MNMTYKNGHVNSKMDRLRTVTETLSSEEANSTETLLKVNDELKELEKEICQTNGNSNESEILIQCKDRINHLITLIRNTIAKNDTGKQ